MSSPNTIVLLTLHSRKNWGGGGGGGGNNVGIYYENNAARKSFSIERNNFIVVGQIADIFRGTHGRWWSFFPTLPLHMNLSHCLSLSYTEIVLATLRI